MIFNCLPSSKIFENIRYESFNFSENEFDKNIKQKIVEADHILVSIAPINGKDIVSDTFEETFSKFKPKWITYLSATSVYGNHNGNWVDEQSDTNPTSNSGIARLIAEQKWISLSKKYNLPIQIFRLSGIYSNQFNVLKRLETGNAKIVNKKNHYFSRIHVEDIANVLIKSLGNLKKGEIFNISDDRPASNEELILHGVKLLGIEKPKTIKPEEIESQVLKNFYKDSKKVSNKKMKKFFNFKLKFPSYIEGLSYIRDNSV